jgi:outer membrane protein assembly factor BamD
MHLRPTTLTVLAALLLFVCFGAVPAQVGSGNKSDLSSLQRLDIMRSRLEALRRSLTSAIGGLPDQPQADKKKPADPDDPRVRLQGLDKEASSILSEVNDLHGKQDRSERYDVTKLDSLEASVADIQTRGQAAIQATASIRAANSNTVVAHKQTKVDLKKKGKLGFLWPFHGGADNDKYKTLTETTAPGRDRELFQEAAIQVRKGNHETGRLLFTTIITTYPDSQFLPLAKLAIADSFYLEGGTSQLIQAASGYQDWLTFFPTDPLADAAMLKVAEAEMRQMGLPDREIAHARKAEQRLKALLQQYPQTRLRPDVEEHLRKVQENLAMHNYGIAEQYRQKYDGHKGGLKGAQSRYKEILDKYPCFSYMDAALFRLAWTYQQEEEPDEAARYYQQILQNYPDSEYSAKAREQLSIIGVAPPEKIAPNTCAKREEKGFVGNLMQQVAGRADVTVGSDGILISRSKKEGTEDLIDLALKGNGQLPSNLTPKPVVQTKTPAPLPPRTNDEQETAPEKKKPGVSVQATPNGPLPDRINPSQGPTPQRP